MSAKVARLREELMRRTVFAFIALVMGCSGNETTGPAGPLPLKSVVVEAPGTLVIGGTLQLNVILRDVSNNTVRNRPISYTSSDARVASVDASGVVTALAEGDATITATSEGKSGQTTLKIVPPIRLCTLHSPLDDCIGAEIYLLVRVNDQPLPVHSPWGVGDWDYDSDAGTWQLTDATIILFADGAFTYALTHRAASGATISDASGGLYERTADSVIFCVNTDAAWSAAISGNSLIVQWSDGTKFTFERTDADG
jgi:hypothetical protein